MISCQAHRLMSSVGSTKMIRLFRKRLSKQLKVDAKGNGNCYPVMGCRSALTPYLDENDNPKYYGRFNCGVVTINLPRIGYLTSTKTEFFARLSHFMQLAKESLEIKRKVINRLMESGLFPYTRRYLQHLNNHFSTIGINGMNECLLNFMGKDITSPEGKEFALEILDFMRKQLADYQEETGSLFNLEATPAESTSYRLARHDKAHYPEIIASGDDDPYYTNSTQLPVDWTKDLFEALDHQDDLQKRYTGGTVFHAFLGEAISDWKMCRKLVKTIAYNYHLPYFSISPTFSVCPKHGYLAGEHFNCPHCKTEKEHELKMKINELKAQKEKLLNQEIG